ncbi:MAG TPA: formyltransferase family protein [Longimicrobiaceae bacterium]|nr:formyltransferase family protein [Longimicrobiaceae bacterium]
MSAAPGVPYVLLGNGAVARAFLEEGAGSAGPPLRVVLNAPGKQRDAAGMRAAAAGAGVPVDEWSPEARERLLSLARERGDAWLLSVYFGHLLDAELLDAFGGRAVNLHPSLLPWCQGVHTNVWPIVEGCPAGVTLHAMVPRVDAGPVLAQRTVPVEPWDTAATLYARLEAEALCLVREAWPAGVLAAWPGTLQGQGGSRHRVADMRALDEYGLDEHPEARAFFDLLRARSFPPYPGLRVRSGGRLLEATVTLREIADDERDD